MSSADHYIGTELELFAQARNWKAYFSDQIRPHLGHRVVEVGAGLGGTTATLATGRSGSWLCLEPDAELMSMLEASLAKGALPAICRARRATLAELEPDLRFDTILYIDVLEHIGDDATEARLAAERLAPGGKLIVLAPAHQWLYSQFDRAIGHHRRYTRRSLEAVIPRSLALVECKYLDSVGMVASAGNRFVSRQSQPKPAQIALWDGRMVPFSRWLDPMLRYALGKSVLGVWKRP